MKSIFHLVNMHKWHISLSFYCQRLLVLVVTSSNLYSPNLKCITSFASDRKPSNLFPAIDTPFATEKENLM